MTEKSSVVREYLEEKAALGKEWVRRKETHPAILALVREFEQAGGGVNDEAEVFCESRVGGLPEHLYHGHPERHALTYQLGHEVYIARGVLSDERAAEAERELLADGFVPFVESSVVDGGRYVLAAGTMYSGATVAVYNTPVEVRARRSNGRVVFLRKGARTRGFIVSTPALIRELAT